MRKFLLVYLIILSVLSLFIGAINFNLIDLFTNNESLETLLISRFPRLITVLLTATALSTAGLIMQKLTMNNFVSPSTGATIYSSQLGIAISLVFLPNSSLFFKSTFSFLFSILGTLIFVYFVNKMNFKNKVMVPLIGIMFGFIISGFTSFLSFKHGFSQTMATWLIGSFSLILRGRYEILMITLPLVVLSIIFARHFNIVSMGKNMANNLGVSYNKILVLGLVMSSLLTASTVVVAGSISYIGLIIPNIISLYKGDNIKDTLFEVNLLGMSYLLTCDVIARLLIAPYELPVELVSGVLGSIIFIFLIYKKLKVRSFFKIRKHKESWIP